MARTTSRSTRSRSGSRRSSKAAPSVRSVKTKEERGSRGQFLRLKDGEKFLGHALFDPDPELDNNPGYFEYYDHWDQQAGTYVPCAGDDCFFCRAGLQPSTRAMTLWYFPKEDDALRTRIFSMNWTLIQEAADILEEEGAIMGKEFRVKRLNDRGDYRMRPTSAKALTKTEMKKLLADAPDLEGIVNRTLATQVERLKAREAMEEYEDEDDDDVDDEDDEDEEDEEPKSKSRRGKAKAAADEDEDEDEDEEEEEDEDEDDEDEEEEEDEDEDEEESEGDEDAIENEEFTIVSVNEDEDTIVVRNSEMGKFTLYLGSDLELDYEEFNKGDTITVDAQKDDEDDWVATSVTKAEQKKRSRSRSRK